MRKEEAKMIKVGNKLEIIDESDVDYGKIGIVTHIGTETTDGEVTYYFDIRKVDEKYCHRFASSNDGNSRTVFEKYAAPYIAPLKVKVHRVVK